MSVSILIISHHEVGGALVNAAKNTYGKALPLVIALVEIQLNTDPDYLLPQLEKRIQEINQGDGVLILTDLFGATPSNIAQRLQDEDVRIVSGLNLPMLIRVMNYPHLNLDQLADTALKGGQAGIMEGD
jgi:PTS system mannose-specific IIA component